MLFEGQSIRCELLDGGIANFCFDSQVDGVNKFDRTTLDEFKQVIDILNNQPDLKGVVVTSGKGVFIVGADITEFLGMFQNEEAQIAEWLSQANDIFNGFEDLAVPTVAAINGIALGGGLEMCLCCDYRTASESAVVGVPETKLGLIPGFGGTTRLPRIIGVDNAVEWIATGKHYKPDAALKTGVLDAVTTDDKLFDAAVKTLKQAIDGKLDWKAKRKQKMSPLQLNNNEAIMSFTTCRASVYPKAGKHYPAPMAAIDVMEQSALFDRDKAMAIEGATFAKLAKTTVATSLIGLFMNDQYLKKVAKKASKAIDKPVANAAVLGAGIMGGGIAYQSAVKGVPIVMKDINDQALDLGMTTAAKILNKGISLGKVTTEKMAATLGSIKPTLNLDDVKDADIVVEAVVENPKIKDAVLQETEAAIGEDAILASNTSTISIDLLAQNLKRPENFCGMHFFNPVHKMKLVEVIRGSKTSDATVAKTVAYAAAMGKSPIVVNDCPGFLVNRILFPYFKAFSLLIRDGADFQLVDKVMEKFGWPMGPAYLLDVVGLDTGHHAGEVLAAGFPDRMSALDNDIVTKLYEAGHYGQKNGHGFYTYSKDKRGKPVKKASEDALAMIADLATPQAFEPSTIIERMMVPMIIESIRCLEDGIVATPAELDMGLIYGIGFPPYLGGAMRHADETGLARLCELADKYQDLGPGYQATEGMRQMAAENKTYYSL